MVDMRSQEQREQEGNGQPNARQVKQIGKHCYPRKK